MEVQVHVGRYLSISLSDSYAWVAFKAALCRMCEFTHEMEMLNGFQSDNWASAFIGKKNHNTETYRDYAIDIDLFSNTL